MPLGAARLALLAKAQGPSGPQRTPHTITGINSPTLSTNYSKFGTASMFFDADVGNDGTDDYAAGSQPYWEIDYSSDLCDFDLHNNPYTFDFWVRPTSADTGNMYVWISDKYSEPTLTTAPNFVQRRGFSIYVSLNRIGYQQPYGTTSGNVSTYTHTSDLLTYDTWNHIAFETYLDSSTHYWDGYINGTKVFNRSHGTWNSTYRPNIQEPEAVINICRGVSGGGFNGGFITFNYESNLDEFRVSRTRRYNGSNFTPPTTAYVNDADTVLLLHADGTNGATTQTDDGG